MAVKSLCLLHIIKDNNLSQIKYAIHITYNINYNLNNLNYNLNYLFKHNLNYYI